MRNKLWLAKAFGLFLLIILLGACNGARHLQEGETLYLGPNLVPIKKKEGIGKFKINNRAEKRVAIWMNTLASPNGPLMGIPFLRWAPMRLYLYNFYYTEKETGFRHWMMENFGEPPVTIEKVNPEVRVRNTEAALFALGHFKAKGSYEIRQRRKTRKARIHYEFILEPAFTIESIEAKIESENSTIKDIVDCHLRTTNIEIGEDFNLQKIENDRSQLIQTLQNAGYFYLNRDNVLVLADTTGGHRQVKLRYQLLQNLPGYKTQPVDINKVSITFKSHDSTKTLNMANEPTDPKEYELRYKLLDRAIELKGGNRYSLHTSSRSISNLSSLNVLSGLSIKYEALPGDSSKLNAHLTVVPSNRFTVSAEGAITTKSSHFLGPSIGVRLTQKNLFGGAQNITYGADAYFDFPTGLLSKAASNSIGIGFFTEYSYPIKGTPFGLAKRSEFGLPRGVLTGKMDLTDRRDYFRMINLNASYGMVWRTSKHLSHRLDFVSANYNNLLETTPKFDSLLAQNIRVAESFDDRFFIGPHYTLIYNDTREEDRISNYYLRFDVEFSGNIVDGIQRVVGAGENGKRTLLGLPYAQYTRIHLDMRYYLNFAYSQKLVLRLNPAVGFAYGNSDIMPYIKQFYVGGTNSIRPASARTLGPGTYFPATDSQGNILQTTEIINNSGDILLEGNLEYRFPILYKLKGALWSDFGNVYLSEPDPLRVGGEFTWDTFIQKMMVTTGVGLRLDVDYLVLRADWGFLLYYPWFPEEARWVWDIVKITGDLPPNGFMIGIGYPF